MSAGNDGGLLQPVVKLLGAGRLAEIETRVADGDVDCKLTVTCLNGTRERGARSQCGDANESLGSEDSGICVHDGLLDKSEIEIIHCRNGRLLATKV
jgi:hypothetical protein